MTRTDTDPVEPRVPRDFTFVVPEDWFRIRLEEDQRSRDVDALVRLLTANRSDRDSLGPEIRQMVRSMIRFAPDEAVEVYLSLTRALGFPVACSMSVTVVAEQFEARHGHDVVAQFLAAHPGAEVSAGVLDGEPTGRSVRHEKARIDSDHEYDTVLVQRIMPVPGTTGFVLLDFSTPLVQVAEQMIALFDVVADSFRWVW